MAGDSSVLLGSLRVEARILDRCSKMESSRLPFRMVANVDLAVWRSNGVWLQKRGCP
jgi:hypothetical protein